MNLVEHPRISIDLPNELWLIVIEPLEDAELYALGCTSRQLNSVVSQFLWDSRIIPPRSADSNDQGGARTKLNLIVDVVERRRVPPVTESPQGAYRQIDKRNGTIDVLDLVSIALNPLPIHELGCEFKAPINTADRQLIIRSISEDYSQLSRFISRLPPGISRINIGLGPFNPQVYRATSQDVWLARTRVLNQLFNTCIKTGCSTFQVRGGYYPSDTEVNINPIHFRWSDLVNRIIPKKKRGDFIFSENTTRVGNGWKIFTSKKAEGGLPPPSLMVADGPTRTQVKDKSNPETLIASKLTHFGIQCALLVFPPFSNWTYQVIATSPHLTTLTLSSLDYLGPHLWEVMLTWLLEALKIQNVLRYLKIESDDSFIHNPNLPPLFWFINELGRSVSGTSSSPPMPLEELDLVWCNYFSKRPARLHKNFDGIVRSRTVKCLKVNWHMLVKLVEINGRVVYSEEEQERLFGLIKERFMALERIELNGVVHIVRST